MSTSGSFGDPSLMDQLHHVEPLTSERAVSAMLPWCMCVCVCGGGGGGELVARNLLSIITWNVEWKRILGH